MNEHFGSYTSVLLLKTVGEGVDCHVDCPEGTAFEVALSLDSLNFKFTAGDFFEDAGTIDILYS